MLNKAKLKNKSGIQKIISFVEFGLENLIIPYFQSWFQYFT